MDQSKVIGSQRCRGAAGPRENRTEVDAPSLAFGRRGWIASAAVSALVPTLLLAWAPTLRADDLVPWEQSLDAPVEDEGQQGEAVAEGEPEYEILDRRVVSEGIVEETVEPAGASALAPGTLGNAPWAHINDRPSPGVEGSVGLPHLSTARVGIPGSLRLAVTGESFATKDFLVAGDRASRQAVTFSAGYTPLTWLETYGSAAFVTVTNTHSSPRLMQVQGDVALGAKTAWYLPYGLSLGADLGLSLLPHIGTAGVGAMGIAPKALATMDARDLPIELPVLAHLEAGFRFDGITRLESQHNLNRLEEFALDAHGYDRFAMAAGLEIPLPIATPFLAWRMRAPLGEVVVPVVQDGSGNVRPLTYGEIVSHVVTLGARITALRDLSLLASVDLGLNGAAVAGIPATMPWNLMFGISYVLDPKGGGEQITRVVERVIEIDRAVPPPPVTGRLSGVVTDAHTGEPLEAAVVQVSAEGSHPVASTSAGAFLSHDIPPGLIEVTVLREGYKPVVIDAAIVVGQLANLELAMERAVEPGQLKLTVVGGEPKSPLQATVRIQGPDGRALQTDASGILETRLTPGEYVLDISADGFLTRQRNLHVEEASRILVDLDMATVPAEALVTMGEGKLELARQIHFQTGRATILPDSYQILDQVIDLIARHDIEGIRIEGHTDNQGGRAANMRLSDARAQSVRQYLIGQGISEDRIEAEGFGPERPIAPNLTQRGRAMNRRVEFLIMGQRVVE